MLLSSDLLPTLAFNSHLTENNKNRPEKISMNGKILLIFKSWHIFHLILSPAMPTPPPHLHLPLLLITLTTFCSYLFPIISFFVFLFVIFVFFCLRFLGHYFYNTTTS
uniref:Uncharacterized protein n=1 Tax=Octopus bimaculoides TaxID=37653 RepID=A0A0L8HBZ4_OCTBM